MTNPINPLGMTKEEYIKTALPYKKMEEGLGNRTEEKLAELPEIPEKDVTLWHLEENNNILFRSHEEALKCLPYILVSRWHDSQPVEPEGKIVSRQFFDNNNLNKYKDIIEDYNRIKNNNVNIINRQNVYDNKLQSIIHHLGSEWEKTEAQRLLKEDIKNTYKEYLELTNNDTEKAIKYLLKTFHNYDEKVILDFLEN